MIFHIATRADWADAQRTGAYTTSTRGRTLAEVGFVHCARREQVSGVAERFYADADEPLVLLALDPARLAPAVVEEGSPEAFPHVYGPLAPSAVVSVEPYARGGDGRWPEPRG